jgi:hypothetical protein
MIFGRPHDILTSPVSIGGALWRRYGRHTAALGGGSGQVNVVKTVVKGACGSDEGEGKFCLQKDLDGWPSG